MPTYVGIHSGTTCTVDVVQLSH